MNENNTAELLKECNKGIKMASSSIEEVLSDVKDDRFREILTESKVRHDKLGDETHHLLMEYGLKDEDPNMLVKGMSWMKSNIKTTINPGDDTIADLMVSGCDMGVRSLQKMLNQYEDADQRAVDLTKQVIGLEEKLGEDLKAYL